MRLDKLRLKNFRCFSEIELELNDKLTVWWLRTAG